MGPRTSVLGSRGYPQWIRKSPRNQKKASPALGGGFWVEALLPPLGDVNADGCINVADLLIVRNNLGESGPGPADANGDGICNVADLLIVRNRLGQGVCR